MGYYRIFGFEVPNPSIVTLSTLDGQEQWYTSAYRAVVPVLKEVLERKQSFVVYFVFAGLCKILASSAELTPLFCPAYRSQCHPTQ